MSGETEAEVSGWTVDTLHQHALRLMDAGDRRTSLAIEAAVKTLNTRIDAIVDFESARDVALRTLIDSQADKVALALAASDKAVTKAEIATEKRFEAVNEFRGQLADQAARLLSRAEFLAKEEAMQARVSDLATRLDRREGSGAGRKDMWGWAIGGAGLVLTLVSIAAVLAKFS